MRSGFESWQRHKKIKVKKYFLVSLLLVLSLIPILSAAQTPLVTCGQPGGARCELKDIFDLVLNVFNFILLIAAPLAGLMVVIGGVMIMVSGGPGAAGPGGVASPNLYSRGKTILWGAVLGLVLILTSWLIIHSVLDAIGYKF